MFSSVKSFLFIGLITLICRPQETGAQVTGNNSSLPPAQVPGVWDALNQLRGADPLLADDINLILSTAVAGIDYPDLTEIPQNLTFNCSSVNQAGFYADVNTRCQVFHRCDLNGIQTSYLCPNQTVFNQIVLVCDWFFNVNCSLSNQFDDYSNSRLYHSNWVLLDTPTTTGTPVAASTTVLASTIAATTTTEALTTQELTTVAASNTTVVARVKQAVTAFRWKTNENIRNGKIIVKRI